MLSQFPPIVILTNGLSFVQRILFITANIFFLILGQKYHEKREKIQESRFFILLGAINIIWLIIELTLMDFVTLLSLSIDEFYVYMLFFIYSPAILVDILTFGVLLILIALKNEAQYGNTLLYAAISSVIYTCSGYISLFLIQFSLSLGINPTGIILMISGIINIISLIFLIMFNIFLIFYSFRLDELYFKIPAILLLINSIIFILNLILLMFYG